MTLYALLIFVHVVSAVTLFSALAIEAVSVARLTRSQTPTDAGVWMELLRVPDRLGPIAMLTTLGSGIWMMALGWGPQPWLTGAFIGFIAMGVVGGVLSGRRLRRFRNALAGASGPSPAEALRSIRSSSALLTSLRLRIGIGVGILGLMTIKPANTVTAAIILSAGVALALLVAAIPFPARRSAAGETTQA